MLTNHASFELGGYRWSSQGDFLNGLVPLSFGTVEDPFRSLALTMDDAPGGGDLSVRGYDFEIGEFGYAPYEGYGYAGAFDLGTAKIWADGTQITGPSAQLSVNAVPEPATWAMMIAGFGLIGAACRRRHGSRGRTVIQGW
jgi:hypothetical protein